MTSARLHLPYVVASFGIPLLLVAAAARLAPPDIELDPSADAAARCPHCGVALEPGDLERISSSVARYRPSPSAATAASSRVD